MKPVIRDVKPIIRLNNNRVSGDIRVLGMPTSTMHQKKSPLYVIQDRKSVYPMQRPQFSYAEHQYARVGLRSSYQGRFSYQGGHMSYLQSSPYRYSNEQSLKSPSNYLHRQPIGSTVLYRTNSYSTQSPSRIISSHYNSSTSIQRIQRPRTPTQIEESLNVPVRVGIGLTYGNKKVLI